MKAALLSPKFRAVFFLNIMWMNCAYISAQFNASYQIKELNLSYTFLMVIGFISNLLRIYITPKIGRYGDYYGMARVLKYFILTLGIQYLLHCFHGSRQCLYHDGHTKPGGRRSLFVYRNRPLRHTA